MTRRCRLFFWTEIISTLFNHSIMFLLYLAKLHQFVSRVLRWLCRCQCESVSPLSVCEVINVCEFPMELPIWLLMFRWVLNTQGSDQKAPQQPLNAAKYAPQLTQAIYIYDVNECPQFNQLYDCMTAGCCPKEYIYMSLCRNTSKAFATRRMYVWHRLSFKCDVKIQERERGRERNREREREYLVGGLEHVLFSLYWE